MIFRYIARFFRDAAVAAVPAPRRRRRPAPARGLFLVAAAGILASAGGASADRHCAPVLERYYFARTVLNDEEKSCGRQRAEAEGYLEEAAVQARICGCARAEAAITGFLRDRDAAQGCMAARSQILQLDEELADLVEACH